MLFLTEIAARPDFNATTLLDFDCWAEFYCIDKLAFIGFFIWGVTFIERYLLKKIVYKKIHTRFYLKKKFFLSTIIQLIGILRTVAFTSCH